VLFRSDTPGRLRSWAWSAALTAVVLLASLSLLTVLLREQVRVIGDVAAPRAAIAADLYFALSDLDAQVARMVLSAGDETLAGSRIDALGTYDERSRQIDEALQRLVATADDEAGRAPVLRLAADPQRGGRVEVDPVGRRQPVRVPGRRHRAGGRLAG